MKLAKTCLVSLVLGSAPLLLAPAASAQPNGPAADASLENASPEDRALARELGTQAFEAFDAARFEDAAALFTKAIALYAAPTLRLGRARSLVQLGRLVAASEEYQSLVMSTPSRSEPESFAKARSEGQAELDTLTPRLAQLTIQVSAPGRDASSYQVEVNGQVWPPQGLGVARPFDPGQHSVVLTADDGTRLSKSVTLAEGGAESVVLEVSPPAPEAPPAVATTAPAPPPPEPAPDASSSGDDRLLYAGVATGVLTVAAVVTGFVALSKRSEYHDENRADVPETTKQSLRDSALTWAWVNTGLSVAAVAGGGLTLYYYSTEAEESGAQPEDASWGVQWSGSF